MEKLLRTTAVELGLSCASSSNPLPGSVIKETAVQNTLSQAWYLGRAVHLARRQKTSYTDAIVRVHRAFPSFRPLFHSALTMISSTCAPERSCSRERSLTCTDSSEAATPWVLLSSLR